MPKTVISEGKTTTEAISNGLKELNVSKDEVNVKIIEEHEKRSFFSILAPRVVKVELTLKENSKKFFTNESEHLENQKYIKISKEELYKGKATIEQFLDNFTTKLKGLEYSVNVDNENSFIRVDLNGEEAKVLIGYRGEVLNSFQVILNSIANKSTNQKIKVVLNISNYREKREKSLEELADKVSKTVIRTGKSITLEPMMAYERKIIHSRLQKNNKVKTFSVGEEPNRRIVISKI